MTPAGMVFLWTLQNFWEHVFHRTSTGDCFWIYIKYKATNSVTAVIVTGQIPFALSSFGWLGHV